MTTRSVDDLAIGNRICIYGRGGKTTLSRALGELTGLPVIELDAIYWLPGWTGRDVEEMASIVRQRIADCPDGWIAEGNYSRIRAELLPLADTVFWLNLPTWTATLRVAMRTLGNVVKRNRICGDNYESLRTALSTDSVVWYYAVSGRRTQRSIGESLAAAKATAAPDALTVHEIRSYRQLRRLYRALGMDARRFRT